MKKYKGKKVYLDKFKWEMSHGNDSSIKKFFYSKILKCCL